MENKITFSPEEISLMIQGLAELPLKHSLDLFVKLRKWQQEQHVENVTPKLDVPLAAETPADVGV